jgi:hypothetical protein
VEVRVMGKVAGAVEEVVVMVRVAGQVTVGRVGWEVQGPRALMMVVGKAAQVVKVVVPEVQPKVWEGVVMR